MSRIARLDALRAYCVIGVFLFHAHLFDNGWIGVQVFFVLSGFLITGILVDYKNRMSAGDFFINFYARRTLRIFPPYYFFLCVFAVLAATSLVPGREIGARYLAELPYLASYTENIRALAGDYVNSDYYSHLWTLSVEEQFYLVWPLALWLTPAARLTRLCLGAVVAAIAFRTGLTGYALLVAQDDNLFQIAVPRAPLSNVDAFATGALALIAQREKSDIFQRAIRFSFAAAFGATAVVLALALCKASARGALFALTQDQVTQAAMYVWGLMFLNISAARLIDALSLPGDAASSTALRLFDGRALQYLGMISYGFYIYHDPMLALAQNVTSGSRAAGAYPLVAFAMTFAAAHLSYRYVETPFLVLKDRLPRRIGVAGLHQR
ncbi:acyltransferase [Methylocystis sp. WRRC1]|uniref:acyltransferase family protein n=1 Tax=Methylocystis sp. WRRC1 TaxID=1732014 RepID=UPI001D15344E|nr:acyltransferase [Methylocystis sp. WRRC1]MCC3244966.1 acyltransferase [Methylocystis sp. WRRC1]